MRDFIIAMSVVAVLLAVLVYWVAKDMREKKREGKRLEETDRALESDPYLAQEIERIRELISELNGSGIGDPNSVGNIRAMAIQQGYNELDDRFFDLYNQNIAELSKGEVYQELREIEQMIREFKAQVAKIAELENQEV